MFDEVCDLGGDLVKVQTPQLQGELAAIYIFINHLSSH